MDPNIIYAVAIAVCVMLSAFFSAIETAASFTNTIRMKNYAENGNKKAKTVLYILDHFDKSLTAILICNNVVNLSCSSIATLLCLNLFGDAGAAISTGATTLLVLTFGEIVPKCLAKEHCDAMMLRLGGFLKGITIILTPLIFIFIKIKELAIFVTGGSQQAPDVTEDELKSLVETIEEQGVLEESEREMVQSVLDFDEKTAIEILTPRVDVTAIDVDDDFKTIKEIVFENRYSRIPVYEDTIDHIIGILHTRDFVEELANGKTPDIRKLIQPAYFIFNTQKLSNILSEFKRKKLHIAVVTDEYGGTLGIVTMEDLIEEIVGEIWDEDEEIECMSTKIGDDEFILSCDMSVEDMLELFEMDAKNLENENLTVGGLILDAFGTVPKQGDSFEFHNLKIIVREVNSQRVVRAIVKRLPDKDKEENKEEKNENK
ncbi:MAG: hemolysin family protein [bacterium]|nr:hemolysin family protein [bacterium]